MKFSLFLPLLFGSVLGAPVGGDVAIAAPVVHPFIPSHGDEPLNVVTSVAERSLSVVAKDVAESVAPGLEKRLNGPPPMFVVTDENFHRVRVYYAADMQRAINEGLGRLNTANPTPPWGLRGTQYPHQYHDYDHRVRNLPDWGEADRNNPMYEYPIFHDHGNGTPHTYTQGQPGRDRVIFDHHGNFITVIAHAQARNRNDFYPGHEAEYDGAGNIVLNSPYHAGSNPDYSNHWGLYAALLMHIQHYKAPPGP